MSTCGMVVSNTRYLSSGETMVNAGIRGWKLHLSESMWCQESLGGICFTNTWSFSTAPDIFKPLLKCSVFKCIPWLNGSFFFWGWTLGFSERGSQDLLNGANVASQLPNIFFCLHMYSLCKINDRGRHLGWTKAEVHFKSWPGHV